jgi:hypothetical protein
VPHRRRRAIASRSQPPAPGRTPTSGVAPAQWVLDKIKEVPMPLFLIERNYAEQLELTVDGVSAVSKINGEIGVNWLFSFLSADKRKSYCLYEAKNADAILAAARRANLPADVIIEVSQVDPERILAAAA